MNEWNSGQNKREDQNQKKSEGLLSSIVALNKKTDIWWRKLIVIVWGLVGIFILYVVIMWIFDKIGL